MLKNINIDNFTIIDQLEIDLDNDMTVITGETGAGKSIIIDALEFTLGARVDHSIIRPDAERATISTHFDIKHIPTAQQWLKEHEFDNEENECLLRRTIGNNGSSKQYINGQACTQSQLRDLGEHLVHIHSQNANQQLYKSSSHQILLDNFAISTGKSSKQESEHKILLNKVAGLYKEYSQIKEEISQLSQQGGDPSSRIDLLQYQIAELVKADAQKNEWQSLTQEHKQLANAEQLGSECQVALSCLQNDNDSAAEALLQKAHSLVTKYQNINPRLQNIIALLDQSLIQCQEAVGELEAYVSTIEINPQRLAEVEQRLSLLHELARKHHTEPDLLPELLLKLETELANIRNKDERLASLEKKLLVIEKDYLLVAKELTASRQKAASQLEKLIIKHIQQLGMPKGQLKIQLTPLSQLNSHGAEKIEFLVSANPGQPFQALAKVASGGEISRISLAIQVVTAQAENTATMIFDEVDVGIGGGTAEIVGKLLRELGKKAQVLCITHLAQVAAQGKQHLRVSKTSNKTSTVTAIQSLSGEERIQEIGRMLGGLKITQQTLAHAEEMLQN